VTTARFFCRCVTVLTHEERVCRPVEILAASGNARGRMPCSGHDGHAPPSVHPPVMGRGSLCPAVVSYAEPEATSFAGMAVRLWNEGRCPSHGQRPVVIAGTRGSARGAFD